MATAKSADRKSGNNQRKKSNNQKSSKSGSSNAKKSQSAPPQKKPVNYRVRSIVLAACGLISLILLLFSGAVAWEFLRSVLYGLFGLAALLIPFLLFYLSFINMKEQQVHRPKIKIMMCLAVVLLVSNDLYILVSDNTKGYFADLGGQFLNAYEAEGVFDRGSGMLGAVLGHPMKYGFGSWQTVILSTIILVSLIFVITKVSLHDIGKAAKRRVDAARKRSAENRQRQMALNEQQEAERQGGFEPPPHYGDEDDYAPAQKKSVVKSFFDDKSKKKQKFVPINLYEKENEKPEPKNEEVAPQPPETELDYSADDVINIIKRANQDSYFGESVAESETVDSAEKNAEKDDNPVSDDIFKPYSADKEEKAEKSDNPVAEFESEVQSELVKKSDYKFPPIQLLKLAVNNNSAQARREIEEKSQKLVSTLDSFGVKVRITDVCSGPSVTRYELQPAPGVKISKITNLADDIALNLAANGVRIEAPIPGKAAVGIEVPNKSVAMVSMRELIDSDVFKNAKSKLTCVLGRDISGQIVTTDLASMPHLLIAGTTGSGKSVCVNSLLMSILYRATPEEVKFLLIDPKMVEFSKYKGIPHLLVPVVSDPKKAAAALNWAVSEMENRYRVLSEYDCKDINSYNDLVESNIRYMAEQTPEEGEEPEPLEINGLPVKTEKMFSCVIAIDELADLMMTSGNEVEESICRLAQKARAAGMHLVIATQRPSVNVITGVIKANIPSRISLKVSSNIDSRTILDTGGAEKLIGKGDMLYMPVGAPKPLRVQGCFASDSEIEGVTRYIKDRHRSQYNEEVEERIKKITVEGADADSSASADDNGDYDEKIEDAIKVVVDAGQASTSLVQRRLKVGYARAGRIIDEMEQLGVIGPHQGSKPREVLMTYQDWLERKNIRSGSNGETVDEAV